VIVKKFIRIAWVRIFSLCDAVTDTPL